MKVNELVRKLVSSKAGLAMLEEAERRDKEMAEQERQATENYFERAEPLHQLTGLTTDYIVA